MTSTHSRRHTTFTGAFTIALLVLTMGCAGSAGTADAPGEGGGGGTDVIALYTGYWAGSFDITIVAGDMGLTLNHDAGVWTGEMSLDVQGEAISAAVESFALTDDGCTFMAFVEGAEIVYIARVEGASMVGVLEAYAESELVADGTFTLIKKQAGRG